MLFLYLAIRNSYQHPTQPTQANLYTSLKHNNKYHRLEEMVKYPSRENNFKFNQQYHWKSNANLSTHTPRNKKEKGRSLYLNFQPKEYINVQTHTIKSNNPAKGQKNPVKSITKYQIIKSKRQRKSLKKKILTSEKQKTAIKEHQVTDYAATY